MRHIRSMIGRLIKRGMAEIAKLFSRDTFAAIFFSNSLGWAIKRFWADIKVRISLKEKSPLLTLTPKFT